MGSGKSQSAIRYMNEHKDKKFIYITPYLDETKRIKKGCPDLRFVEPSDKIPKYNRKKSEHTAALIKRGKNITTTHQAFKRYTPETLSDIREKGYTLIIDENVDVLEAFDFHMDDLQLAIDGGYIKEENNTFSLTGKKYEGKALHEMFMFFKSRELIRMTDEDKNLFYWALPPELLTSFKDVFILTYLFEGQCLHHFMRIYDIPYEYIGIERTEDGGYRFGDYPGYIPEYISHLKDMLNIIDVGKINNIGDDYYSLSMNWFKKDEQNAKQIKNNISNCINNIWRDVPIDKKLWGSYKGEFQKIKGKGYTKPFLTFNAKATNEYRDKEYLVYIANLFMNVNEKKFYQMHGIKVDEDIYALSIMVQWIWRSAIRDGGKVNLYIPSRRMRNLLIDWIDKTSKGEKYINE